MRFLSLFSGIGGFDLGLEQAGMTCAAQCEIEEFPRKILNMHWPHVPCYPDVKELTYERLKKDGITDIGLIAGGFPCQDLSVAGSQKGIDAERSGLWSEFARIISEIYTANRAEGKGLWVCVENVPALLTGDSGEGIQQGCEFAPRGDDVADTYQERLQGKRPDSDTQGRKEPDKRQTGLCNGTDNGAEGPIKPRLGLLADGISSRLSRSRWLEEPGIGRVGRDIPDRANKLKGLGNAVVPALVKIIGEAIMEKENVRLQ